MVLKQLAKKCSVDGWRFFGVDFAVDASGACPVHPVRSANERGQCGGERDAHCASDRISAIRFM